MESTTINGTPQQIDFGSIPAELQERDQWVLWKTVIRDGKATKMPLSVFNTAASSTDSKTWTSFDNAGSHYDPSQHSGIGFVFTSDDQFCGIDLDGCRDPVTGVVADWAVDEVLRFASYTEISPSQTGLKIWITADSSLPKGRKKELRVPEIVAKTPAVEIYTQGRYFAVTGCVYKQYRHVEHREAELQEFLKDHWPAAPAVDAPPHEWRSDDAVVERARKYVARIPGAVSGSSGHNTTFHVACRLVKGFDLSTDQALDVLTEWNATCDPPWSEHELQHKIESASKASGDTGYLRNVKPERWDEITASRKFVGETPVSPAFQRVSPTKAESFKIKSLVSTPFPIQCLPSRLSSFVQSVSRAVGCDHSFAALPALAVVSTAIGNSRRVSTKQGNYQPLSIWPVVIGLSGSQKSEPFDMATDCLNDIENNYEAEFNQVSAKHRAAIEHYKLDLKAWRGSGIGDPPLEPEMPLLRQMVVKDFTSEALIKIHSGNPRGLLCCNEELSGWFGSFERYAGKGAVSGEQAKFLEFYDGKRTTIDRVSAKRIVIHRSFVNITGTIQPGIIQQALTSESRSNGLASRLWMAYPPSVLIRWRDEVVSTRTKHSYADLVKDLLSLSGEVDSSGFEKPALLELSTDSRKMFKEYMNDTGDQCFVMFGDVRAAWAKFIGRCVRLAGIIHCCRQADGDIQEPWTIDTDSMQAAITLCEWSKAETLRVYKLLKEDAYTNSLRLLAAWIKHHGGSVTARDLFKHKRDIETTDDAEQLLRNLQDAGFGKYELQPVGRSGGRPTFKFILNND